MKLRSTIMVVSMIALPLAAVIGFKWPKFMMAEKPAPLTRKLEPIKPTAEAAPAWDATAANPKSPDAKQPDLSSLDTATPDTILPIGGLDTAIDASYQVEQAANHDVRANGSEVQLVSAAIPADNTAEIRPLPVPVEANETTDPFLQIQQRLRALGAIHYSLETWGTQGEAYRFQCRMAAGHNPNYSRHFEATDVDPVRVMQTVLGDVEAWKSGRLP